MPDVIEISEFVGGNSEMKHGLQIYVGPDPRDELDFGSAEYAEDLSNPAKTLIRLRKSWEDPIDEKDLTAVHDALKTDGDLYQALGEIGGTDCMELHVDSPPNYGKILMGVEVAKHVMSALSLPELRVVSWIPSVSDEQQHHLLVADEV